MIETLIPLIAILVGAALLLFLVIAIVALPFRIGTLVDEAKKQTELLRQIRQVQVHAQLHFKKAAEDATPEIPVEAFSAQNPLLKEQAL